MSISTNSKIYKILKPIVNDHTKLCKKDHKKQKSQEDVKIKFSPDQNFNITSYIEKNIDQHLRCLICKQLFKGPITCYKCNTPFCSLCITNQIEQHSRCPKCYQIIFIELMKPDFSLEKEYNSPFKCPHKDCYEIFPLKDLNLHLANCLFDKKRSEHCDKLIYTDYDPLMQKHLFEFMQGLSLYQPNIKQTEFKPDMDVQQLMKRNTELKSQLKKFNDYANKTLLEMSEYTKNTDRKSVV